MSAHAPAQPVGGPILNSTGKILLTLGTLGLALVAWRFAVGLGASTGLSDGYPWGIWIAFDVVTGTALACGGYAMALLVYIFNKGRYHPLVRPAILTSVLGYSMAGLAVAIDVGRPWLIWRVPTAVNRWNLNSALLEVALCIMAYVGVLWVELAPAFLEKWKDDPEKPKLAKISGKLHAFLEKALIWIIALGVVLPTMHQSSLGSVMMLVGPRLHPLWHTTLLPLFFLISCVSMGYAVVACESTLATRIFGRRDETPMLRRLWGLAAWISMVFIAVRWIDLILRGRLAQIFAFDAYSIIFLVESAIFVAPFVMYLRHRQNAHQGNLFAGALVLILGGALYRFTTYLVAFKPGEGWTYFPTTPELLVTLGLVALEILAYIAIVKRFPILAGRAAPKPLQTSGATS